MVPLKRSLAVSLKEVARLSKRSLARASSLSELLIRGHSLSSELLKIVSSFCSEIVRGHSQE